MIPNAVSETSAPASHRRKRQSSIPADSRRRVARACNECRRLKEKCPGGDPCSRCTRFRRPCGYHDIPKLSRIDAAAPDDRDVQSFFDVERIQALERIVQHFTGAKHLDKSHLTRILTSLTAGSEGNPSAHERSSDATSDDEEFTISPLSSTTALHSGELSHSSFSLNVQHKVERRLNAALPELRGNYEPAARSPLTVQHRSQVSMVLGAASIFPPAEVASFLVDVFFEVAQTNYSYVDEHSLRQKLGRFYSAPSALEIEDAPWVCMTLMVFAVGTQFAHLSSRSNGKAPSEDGVRHGDTHLADDAVALELYHKASTLIPDVITAGSVESVQAFLVLGVYTLPIDAAGLSCTYLGIAIKIATLNGMHCKHYGALDVRQAEIRKRIWWTAYTLERRICVLHGRPTSISKSEIDQDMPQDVPELRSGCCTTNLPNILAMIRLTDALAKAKNAIHKLKKALRQQGPVVIQPVLQLKQELHQYWESLPEKIFCRDLTPGKPMFRYNVHLAMMYHLTYIFIGRSFILKDTNPGASVGEAQLPDWMRTRDELVRDCIRSALTIIDLCQALDDDIGLARTSYTEFTSCCAALLVVLAQRISAGNSRLHNACGKGIKLLKKMSVGIFSNSSERLTVDALEMAIHKLDRCGGGATSTATSGSDYAQFRHWAMQMQASDSRITGEKVPQAQSRWLGNGNGLGPAFLEDNLSAIPDPLTPSTGGLDANFGFQSFELGECASVAGLDQWFEFGLH